MLLLEDLAIAFGLFALLLAALEAGFQRGRRSLQDRDDGSSAQIGSIQGAILGMLGLLLAFSFAAASARFLERQDLIVREANAIRTSYLRADLLDEPQRSELRAALQSYTEHRIAVFAGRPGGVDPGALAEVERLHERIWRGAVGGVTGRLAVAQAVLTPINDVIELHATRLAAARKHIPGLVLALLIACSALALAVIGYGSGLGGRRRVPLTLSLALLISAALWITIDLDYPRRGLIRLSDAPLQQLHFEAPSRP